MPARLGIAGTTVFWMAALLAASASIAEIPRLNGFEISRHRISRDEILKGGMRDAIRSVERPRFVAPNDAPWADAHLPVLGVAYGGVARAYPLFMIEWHIAINDTLGGEPIAVTYDPLTGTPRAFKRSVRGSVLDFGVSGLIHQSSVLLYDRASESLWLHFDGRAVSGRFSGAVLERIEVRQESLGTWRHRYPDTELLDEPESERIAYSPEASQYEPYWQADKPAFPVKVEDRRFHAKELVLGVEVDGRARAYLGSVVARHGGSTEDELGGKRIRVEFSPTERVFRYEVGEGVRVSESFWFAWKAFHPDTEIWRDPGRVPGRAR